jgi:hypothetical protein
MSRHLCASNVPSIFFPSRRTEPLPVDVMAGTCGVVQFTDDDKNVHLAAQYEFDIVKEWPAGPQ